MTLKRQERPVQADVTLTAMLYSNNAHAWWERAQPGDKLFQFQFEHNCANSVTHNLMNSMNAFLAEKHAEDAANPANLQDLEANFGIRMVITRSDANVTSSQSGNSFVMWRVAFYVAGAGVEDAQAFLHWLDGFWVFRRRIGAQTGMVDFTVHVHPETGVALTTNAFVFPSYHLHAPVDRAVLPFRVSDAWPPSAPRSTDLLKVTLQVEADDRMGIVLTGPTYKFRPSLRAYGSVDLNLGTAWARSITNFNTEYLNTALLFFGDSCLQASPVHVHIEDLITDNTANSRFVQALRNLPQVFSVTEDTGDDE